MIIDTLENLPNYFSLQQGFEKAFKFLSQDNIATLEPGKYTIESGNEFGNEKDQVFAIIVNEPGRDQVDAEIEGHHKYIDIQYVLSGVDAMGWRSISDCQQESMPYDPDKDLIFYKENPTTFFDITAGSYAIFFPEDGHMPFLNNSSTENIHKVIVKIAI